MTRTGAVAEQPIVSINAAARRAQAAKPAGEGDVGEAAERGAFPELLTRLADGEAGPVRKLAPRADAAERGEPGGSSTARWRHIGPARTDMVVQQELEAGEPAASGNNEGAPTEPPLTADGTPIGRGAIGELAPMQVVLPEPPAAVEAQVDPTELAPHGQMAETPAAGAANVSKLKVRPSDSGAAANPSAEVEVKVSVIGRETHFAPIVPSSLPGRATNRPAAPASVNRAAPAQAAAEVDGDAARSAEDLPAGAATKHADAGVVRRASQAGARGEQFDPLERMRAAQAGEAKAEARPSGDRPTVERAGGGPANAAESRASSVGQPQPLPPALSVSAIQQIADRVANALEEQTSVRPPSASGAAAQNPATAAQLKVLHIELQPAELGTIEIRLSLREDALELRLDASRAETAALIGRDKHALAQMLRSAGYLIDAMTVQIAEPDRNAGTPAQPGSQGTQTPSQSMAHTQSGGSQADARSDRADRQPQGDHRSNPVERDEHASDQPSLRHADGAVYV